MALTALLILRKPRSGCLEVTLKADPTGCQFFHKLSAKIAKSRLAFSREKRSLPLETQEP